MASAPIFDLNNPRDLTVARLHRGSAGGHDG